MTSWDGLPDFGAPIAGGPGPIFAAFGGGPARAMPDRIAVAKTDQGRPDFHVELVRPALSTKPPWGALRLRVAVSCDLDASLAAVRAVSPAGALAIAQPSGGYLRLVSAGAKLLPPDLAQPSYVDWSNLAAARLLVPNLSATTVALLKNALLDATELLVWARLELEVPGVAPRVPATVAFSPKALLAVALPTGTRIAWQDLLEIFTAHGGSLPVTASAGVPDPRMLGAALADRVRMAWGTLVPSETGQRAAIEFPELATLPAAVQWDLRQPADARRPVALELDPLMEPRALAQQVGLAALVDEHTVPILSLGAWEISAFANVPDRCAGVAAIGVTLRAPAAPPARRAPIEQTIELDATRAGTARLTLGPKEPLAYTATPFVVLAHGTSLRRLDGAPRPCTTDVVELGPSDFPVAFVPVSATPGLLAIATVEGALTYAGPDGAQVALPFALSPAQPATALPLPRDATGSITATARPLDPGAPVALVALGPQPAAPLELGPHSFPGYGPHTVQIAATLAPGEDAAVDVVADEALARGATRNDIATIHLTERAPTASWKYFATSPFTSGYRYRAFRSDGAGEWSAVESPDQPLDITPEPPTSTPRVFDLEGVHVYLDDAGVARYLPPAPIAVRADNGHAMVSVLKLGASGGFLQLSTRFDLEPDTRASVTAALAAQQIDVGPLGLQPAPIRVTQIAVQLRATPDAPPIVLATSSGSGVPPWDAIFNARLGGDQLTLAARAVTGERGLLAVVVTASLPPELTATLADSPTSIEATADVATWLAAR